MTRTKALALFTLAAALLGACPDSPCEKVQAFCREELSRVQTDFEWLCRLSDKFNNNCEQLEQDLVRLEAKCKAAATTAATCEDDHRGLQIGLRTVVKALRLLRH